MPKGGPDGGDGGRGGHIMLRGNKQYWTLLHLKYQKHVIAEDGVAGAGARKKGKDGRDVVLEVPLGTVARDAETGASKVEITRHDQLEILTPGGRGGLGNDHFKTATNQSPRYAQPGEPGKEEWVILELKLLADVGLVGFPNAGKSTLLSVLSAARPEIADYPFTTLTPNLGVVDYKGYKSFVVADIPGLIEGASQGRGLGHRFLRHIERNSVLLFMIPCDTRNIMGDYNILLDELRKYNPELLDKERVVAITKADMLDEELQQQMLEELPAGFKVQCISSITGQGIEQLKTILWTALNRS